MDIYPDVYVHLEDEDGHCMCGHGEGNGLQKVDVRMKISENTLRMDLFEHHAMPELPLADEIAAVRVHVRGKSVAIYPIYRDPVKTATAVRSAGHGCVCYTAG